MKKVIVPTDFSVNAEKAYPIAASLALKYDASVLLYHISSNHLDLLNAISPGVGGIGVTAQFLESEKAELENVNNQLEELKNSPIFSGVTVEFEVAELGASEPAEKIISFLNQKEHEIVVMGTEGANGFSDSNAETVARHTTVPLLTVKEQVDSFNPKKIVWCTDYKTINQTLCNDVMQIQEKYEAEVDVLFINTPKGFKDTVYTDREAKRVANRYGLTNVNFVVHNSHDVEKGVFEYVEKVEAGLIVLATQGLTGFSLFLYSSFTEDIINHSPVPVYSFNMKSYVHKTHDHNVVSARGFTG